MSIPHRILFLCTGNSCRSQMAEAWTNHLHSARIEAYSAGIAPKGVDPLAVQVMAEEGIDISQNTSKDIAALANIALELVITVCGHANENCPRFPGSVQVMHVGFDDPPRLAGEAADEQAKLDCYRRVRDEIRDFVAELPERIHL